MTLNTSGPISLNGPITGESVALELLLPANATINLTGTSVRSLTGIASGAVAMPNNLYGKSYTYGTWITPAGNLGNAGQGRSGWSKTVSATVNVGTPVYSVQTGALPSGLTLNSTSGLISGTVTAVPGTYSFALGVQSSIGGKITNRSFSITVVAVPTFTTPSGYLGRSYTQQAGSYTISATNTVSYSLVSGSLPPGYSLNTSTGVISGTAPAGSVADYSVTTYSFTIQATGVAGYYTQRGFSINIRSRYVGYSCFYAGENGTISGSVPAGYGYVFNRMLFSSYGTPPGTCPNYSISGCNSGSSNSWTGPIGQASFAVGATNSNWGDPCGGTLKWMKLIINYGPF
jgi:hypothetical protein